MSVLLLAVLLTGQCNAALWPRVFNPKRLTVLQSCITVTGVITATAAQPDGDLHIKLKPDLEFEHLLTAGNIKRQKGCLVLEVICRKPPKLQAAKLSCGRYRSRIKIPRKGTRIRATGVLVRDRQHGWNEVHPVTRIKRLSPRP